MDSTFYCNLKRNGICPQNKCRYRFRLYLVETYMRLIMKNIFENTKSIWVKYSDYEIKKSDNGVDYITPTSNATPIMRHIFGTCFRARETDFLLCNYLQFQFIIVATLLWFRICLLLLLLFISL